MARDIRVVVGTIPVPVDGFVAGTTKPQPDGTWWLGSGGTRNVGPRFDYDPDDANAGTDDGPWTIINPGNGKWNPSPTGSINSVVPGEYKRVWINGTINPQSTAAGVKVIDFVQRALPITPTPVGQQYGCNTASAIPPLGPGVSLQYGDMGVPEPLQNYNQSTGIRPSAIHSLRCKVWGFVDGIMPYGPSAGTRGRFFDQGSSIVTGPHFPDDGGNHSDGSHNDGCQCEGNVGLELLGTALHGSFTSGILATNNVAGGYDFLHLYDCWWNADHGAKINLAGASIAGIEIFRNKLARNLSSLDINVAVTNRTPAWFGMAGTTGNVNGWTPDGSGNHNVLEDDGSPCRFSNG